MDRKMCGNTIMGERCICKSQEEIQVAVDRGERDIELTPGDYYWKPIILPEGVRLTGQINSLSGQNVSRAQ